MQDPLCYDWNTTRNFVTQPFQILPIKESKQKINVKMQILFVVTTNHVRVESFDPGIDLVISGCVKRTSFIVGALVMPAARLKLGLIFLIQI
jgi:hypothetical protein